MRRARPTTRQRIRFLFFASGIATCLFTVIGYLGIWFWLCDLASHFRLHYAAWLVLLSLVFFWRRSWRPGLLFAAFGLFNLVLIAPYYKTHETLPPSSHQSKLRVYLGNVLILNTQYGRMEQVIADSGADVVVLQELSPKWFTELDSLRNRYPYSARSAPTDRFGIGLWSRYPIRQSEAHPLGQTGRSTLIADIDIGGRPITLVATHPPPPFTPSGAQNQQRQLRAVAKFVARRSGSHILLGDLNITPWTAAFARLARDSGLRDSAASQGVRATWPSWFGACGLPLDHCLITPDLHIIGKRTGPPVGSDHLPLVLDLAWLP